MFIPYALSTDDEKYHKLFLCWKLVFYKYNYMTVDVFNNGQNVFSLFQLYLAVSDVKTNSKLYFQMK